MKKMSLIVTLLCIVAAVVIIVLGVTGRFRAQEPVTPERVTYPVAATATWTEGPCEVLPLIAEQEGGDHIDIVKAGWNLVEIQPLPDEPEPVYLASSASESVAVAESDPATVLAQMVWGEGRNQPPERMAAIVWCALNRVDAGYGGIVHVVTAPGQFVGYSASNPVDPDILALVRDVLDRWQNGGEGRTLPSGYLWFHGTGTENVFRDAYNGGNVWDWSLPDPYEGD